MFNVLKLPLNNFIFDSIFINFKLKYLKHAAPPTNTKVKLNGG